MTLASFHAAALPKEEAVRKRKVIKASVMHFVQIAPADRLTSHAERRGTIRKAAKICQGLSQKDAEGEAVHGAGNHENDLEH